MSDMKDILGRVKPVISETYVCLDGDLYPELDRAQQALDAVSGWKSKSLDDVDPRPALREQLAEVEELMRATSQRFTFRSIGDKASSDLLAAHPSPKDEDGEEKFAWDPQTYPAALVAAASVDPKMSVEEVTALFDVFNLAQRNKIFGAAYSANNHAVDVPFSSPASAPAGDTEQS